MLCFVCVGLQFQCFIVVSAFDCSFSTFYCRMRSAYPYSDLSTNAGFVWSPSVGLDELHQGLGVSLKVTVISEHFREPLTFTCDGETLTDRPNDDEHWPILILMLIYRASLTTPSNDLVSTAQSGVCCLQSSK